MTSRSMFTVVGIVLYVGAMALLIPAALNDGDGAGSSTVERTTITRVTAITEMGDPGFKVTLSDGQVMYVMACPDEGASDKLRLTCYDGKRGELRLADGTTYGK